MLTNSSTVKSPSVQSEIPVQNTQMNNEKGSTRHYVEEKRVSYWRTMEKVLAQLG